MSESARVGWTIAIYVFLIALVGIATSFAIDSEPTVIFPAAAVAIVLIVALIAVCTSIALAPSQEERP